MGNCGTFPRLRELINEVRKRPALWDPALEFDKDCEVTIAWIEITDIMLDGKGTIEEKRKYARSLAQKWNNVRTSSTELEGIIPEYNFAKPNPSINFGSSNCQLDECKSEKSECESSDTQENDNLTTGVELNTPDTSGTLQKKRKMNSNQQSNKKAKTNSFNDTSQYNETNSKEFDIFGQSVAVQLKQIPLYDAIVCQGEIQAILTKKRLEVLQKQGQGPCESSSRNTTPSPTLDGVEENHSMINVSPTQPKEEQSSASDDSFNFYE